MCGGLVVLSPGSPSQVLCAVLIMLFHMLVVLRASPFLRDSEDVSSFISSLGLTLMYLGALQSSNEKSYANANLSYASAILDVLPIVCIGVVLGIMFVMDCGVCNVCLRACRKSESEGKASVGEGAGMTRVTPVGAKDTGNGRVTVEQSEQLRSVRLQFGASSKEYKLAIQEQQHSRDE